MEIKQDYSCGVIPVIKTDQGWNVFLIYQYGSSGDVFWTFPKGHLEAGESPLEAATRELLEETGIVATLREDIAFEQAYTFLYEGCQIEKKVTYYLGIASSTSFSIQEDEVQEAGWFSFEEAAQKLTHDSAKEILQSVSEALANF